MDILRYFKKLPATAEMTDDTLTDGLGNLYAVPDKGVTPLFHSEYVDDSNYKFRYNFDDKAIEIFSYDENDESWHFLESYNVKPEDVADGFDYWCAVAFSTVEDEIYNELQLKEAYELYGEIIDEDKDTYNYAIRIQVEIVSDMYDYQHCFDDYKEYIEKFKQTRSLFGEKLDISTAFDSWSGELAINISFPMPLTKEDILEIYNDIEPVLVNVPSEDYTVNVEIENIYEI